MADSPAAGDATLDFAFRGLEQALATGDLERFYGAMLPDAIILDEDLPFRVSTAGFRDHIAFHGSDNRGGFAWMPHHVAVTEAGRTGTVTGFAMFRGKPRDAGFRLRPMLFTRGWTRTAEGWRMASWHQSPVVGHVTVCMRSADGWQALSVHMSPLTAQTLDASPA